MNTGEILQKVNGIEAMANALIKEAAMLRHLLQAGGQPVAKLKDPIKNIDIATKAKVAHEKKMLRKIRLAPYPFGSGTPGQKSK